MLVVTGAAGFIGSTVAHRLTGSGHRVMAVDECVDGAHLANLVGTGIEDVITPGSFMTRLASARGLATIDGVVHLGALTDTTSTDAPAFWATNVGFTVKLIDRCNDRRIPVVYASSAAVYGASERCVETPECEYPLNLYGHSKLAVDRYVRRQRSRMKVPVTGLRFFNVYGERESHKGAMASMPFRLAQELREHGTASIFGASHGLGPGGHSRDFVHVDDVVDVIYWALGVAAGVKLLNVGTGEARSFLELTELLIESYPTGVVRFIQMPENMRDRYQSRTCADLDALRSAGFTGEFARLEEGIGRLQSAGVVDQRGVRES